MTDIKEGELFRIYLQLVLMGILAVFYFFYAAAPIGSQGIPEITVDNNTKSVSSSGASPLPSLISSDAGAGQYLPNGADSLFIIASIVLIPLTIMNGVTVFRFALDIVKGWL